MAMKGRRNQLAAGPILKEKSKKIAGFWSNFPSFFPSFDRKGQPKFLIPRQFELFPVFSQFFKKGQVQISKARPKFLFPVLAKLGMKKAKLATLRWRGRQDGGVR